MSKPPRDPRNDTREARLKAALRANLARRKAQGRARIDDGGAGADATKNESAGNGMAENEQNGPQTPPDGRAPENEG